MDVSAVGHANNAHGPLVTAATQQQQQVSPPSTPPDSGEDSVEISTDAKTRAAQSVVDK